jgi:hypothetical protein
MFEPAFWETASYVVTVIGLPLAIFVFVLEQRKERQTDEDENYLLLANSYNDFLKVVLDNPDLQLRSTAATPNLTPEQHEKMMVIFEMLVAVFERAYLFAYTPARKGPKARRWNAWEDFMREWVRREDFRTHLAELLRGEDPEFAEYLRRLAQEELAAAGQGASA